MKTKLYKSRKNKIFSGVCGGLAQYFNIDAFLLRLAFAFLMLPTEGAILIIYILMAALIPYEPLYNTDGSYNYYSSNTYSTNSKENPDSFYNGNIPNKIDEVGKHSIGLFLIVLGLAIFIGKVVPGFYSTYFIPLLLFVLGIMLIVSSTGSKNKETDNNYMNNNRSNSTSNNTNNNNNFDNNSSTDYNYSTVETNDEVIIDKNDDDDYKEQKVENGEGI